MINNRWMKLIATGFASLLLVAVAISPARSETNATLTASVVDQTCQGGDFVNVTLTATVSPPQQGIRYAWDFENDGVIDTQPSSNPTVTHAYPDEVTVTARVVAVKSGRMKADTVTFGTLRCE